jgi:hypothetical protein
MSPEFSAPTPLELERHRPYLLRFALLQLRDRTAAERITLRLHVGICDACTRFTSQVQFLRRALKAFPGSDDPETR